MRCRGIAFIFNQSKTEVFDWGNVDYSRLAHRSRHLRSKKAGAAVFFTRFNFAFQVIFFR